MHRDDWFREPTPAQRMRRALLVREADEKGTRFGIGRRGFLGSSMGAMAALSIARTSEAAQGRFRSPGEDAYAELDDACERAGFTRLDHSTAHDWELIERACVTQEEALPDTIMALLRDLEGLHAGFGVDQRMHCTQTATRATRANVPDELVLVALVHDAAKVVTNANHPELIAAIARPYVSEGGYRVLRHHMEFQWKHYGALIGMPTDLRDRYVGEPWYGDAVRFSDELDQRSFDPAYETLPLEEFEPLVRAFFGTTPERRNRTADDCL